ncbi:MAG TPA: dTDP-4-dehydrorhamnose 3,5-epimerase family protein [Verrucomicrobiae bacterium]|nr:dTDP-4-dehydrorhamnose 3,5-epimerase family protein [Verrucomicrobiae bacterium]
MSTAWQTVEVRGIFEIPGLLGVRVEALPLFKDARGSLHELFRVDEIPADFKPLMACASWSLPGVTRGPHQHVGQDDYFTFAGPSDFSVYLWDDRPGSAKAARGWVIHTGEKNPARIYVPRGVVHAYRNTGNVSGLVVTVTSLLFKGEGRREPVDEIRHELNPNSPYKPPQP